MLRDVMASMLATGVLLVGLGPMGCREDGSATSGRRIALDVSIAASPDSRQFTNARGWSVSLTKAVVSTGAVYVYDGETVFAGASRTSWSLVRPAFAHPGHYEEGNARGEMLSPSSADLLAGATLGIGHGVTGKVRSATFTFFAPATGPLAAELGSNVIVLEGSATKAVMKRVFRAEVTPEEMQDAVGRLQIEGCPFVAADMQGDGTVTITMRVPLWLDQVDFEDVPESTAATPVLLAGGIVKNQLVRGAKQAGAYNFAYVPR